MIRALFVAGAVALAVPPAALTAPAPSGTPSPVRVRLVATSPGAGRRAVAGTLAAVHRAVLSTRMAATVKAIEVDEGASVKEGMVLVRLSDDGARAQLAAARTALANAAAQEKRIERLAVQRSATAIELDQARAHRAQAQASLTSARANLSYTEVRAPFAGTVQARRANGGDLLGPGQPLLEIEGPELEVVASLSDDEASGIAIGQTLQFESGGGEGTAVVTALAAGGDALSHRRTLRARVRDGAVRLRSGAFARLLLPARAGATAAGEVWVPKSALVERGDLTGVFVVAAGQARLRWLALGEPLGDRVLVRAGLAAGEPVVDAPGALRDGQNVEVER